MSAAWRADADGQSVVVDIDELTAVIADLENVRAGIFSDGMALQAAMRLAVPPPADDVETRRQTTAYVDSLAAAAAHNDAMAAQVERHLTRLVAARDAYLATDTEVVDRFRHVEEGGR